MTNTQLKHLALIPDGNRRWAKAHHLPILAGHRQVVDKVFPALVEEVLNLGIPFFTIWGFSTENWGRASSEVTGIMALVKEFLADFSKKLQEKNVRLNFIGRQDNLSEDLKQAINSALEMTQNGKKLVLTIAFNYGGRDEIIRAANRLTSEGKYPIDEATFAQALDTGSFPLPDPDLIVRTGGEKRLSGFMSWQTTYSELYFTDKYMPDWQSEDLRLAVAEFRSRQRRFGK